MGTRFHEKNVHAVSVDSNRFDPDHRGKYEKSFRVKFGGGEYRQLEMRSHSLAKFTRPEIEEMIDSYREKVAQLRKEKGL